MDKEKYGQQGTIQQVKQRWQRREMTERKRQRAETAPNQLSFIETTSLLKSNLSISFSYFQSLKLDELLHCSSSKLLQ